MTFPVTRPRRLRRREGLRRLVRETSLDPAQLVLPLFVVPGSGVRRPLQSLPGVAHVSPDEAAAEAARAAAAGVGGVLLFGLPATKDAQGSGVGRRRPRARGDARHPRRRAGARSRHRRLPLRVHRPRPLRRARATATVANDATLPLLATGASRHAEAGADVIAPSRHDGRPHRRRSASARRGGLRRTARSCPTRRSSPRPSTARSARPPTPPRSTATAARYQMDPANAREALREVAARRRRGRRPRDGQAGAGLPRRHPRASRERVDRADRRLPRRGEYAMVKAAAAQRLARRAAVELRDPDRDPPRRRRPDPHLPRHRGRASGWTP